ncbi:6999_t:CDS:2 [Funneliformis mosseae]|uniref:6999_t:CDS:1 n=1 Tax=Funneliformis mosseae TaxID=27381 RepID=A0A9N9FXU4_FUNMO|nr:6999_t:CDS:2 [Funneliformis mosseae]
MDNINFASANSTSDNLDPYVLSSTKEEMDTRKGNFSIVTKNKKKEFPKVFFIDLEDYRKNGAEEQSCKGSLRAISSAIQVSLKVWLSPPFMHDMMLMGTDCPQPMTVSVNGATISIETPEDALFAATAYTGDLSFKVEEKDNIDGLKEKIRAKRGYLFYEQDKFTIWKINLPKKEYPKLVGTVRSYVPFVLGIKEVLGGKELSSSKEEIKQIFPNGLDEDFFHIAVQIQPVPNDVFTWEQLGCPPEKGYRQLNEFHIDHGLLLEVVLNGRPREGKPVLVGSRPPSNEKLWDFIREKDYEVNTLERNAKNREKGVDPTLGEAIYNSHWKWGMAKAE